MRQFLRRTHFIAIPLLYVGVISPAKTKGVENRVLGQQRIIATKENIAIKHRIPTTYIVRDRIELYGDTLRIPRGNDLLFRGGSISNGILIGDSTAVIHDGSAIFSNIHFGGTWIVPIITTDLFFEKDYELLYHITTLSSDSCMNMIWINTDCMTPIKAWDSYFTLKSHTRLMLNADIYALPTSYKGGYCINIKGHDIEVQGNGHSLLGDIHKQNHNRHEWLHGLNIDKSSRNVKISNIKAKYFCGDGFYSGGSDIIFDNIQSEYNGRQGLSITSGNNITIINSTFRYTGSIDICHSKGPGAGIDIEPNGNDQVHGVKIKGCNLSENYKYMRGYTNDFQVYNATGCDVELYNSSIGGIYLGSSSGITINGCQINGTIFGIDENISGITIVYSGKPNTSNISSKNIAIKDGR